MISFSAAMYQQKELKCSETTLVQQAAVTLLLCNKCAKRVVAKLTVLIHPLLFPLVGSGACPGSFARDVSAFSRI